MRDPLHRWSPPRAETYGDLAAGLAEQVGMPMDDEQKAILDDIFAEDEPGIPTCFEVGVVAPRQNLKTATLEIAALTDVFILGEELHVWTAHLFDTAQRAFNDMVAMIGRTPDLQERCKWPPSASHGDEAIELLTGERIEFHARSSKGGRGLSGDKITLDEALYLTPSMMGALLPILATRPGAQVRYGSSAGVLNSAVLRSIRDRGRQGKKLGERRLAWHEYGAPRVDCATKDCPHVFLEVQGRGCALDREDLWFQANTALGRRISLETMRDFRRSMPWWEFAREFLSWWEDPLEVELAELAIDPDVYRNRRDSTSRALDPVTIGIDVSPTRRTTISVAGWREDGRKHGEVIQSGPGTHWVIDVLLQIIAQVDPAVLVLDRVGPVTSLIPEIEAAGLEPTLTSMSQRAGADRGLVDDLEHDAIHVAPSKPLDDAAAVATWRDLPGGGQAFNRPATGDISPLVSLSLARFGLLQVAARPAALPPAEALPLTDRPGETGTDSFEHVDAAAAAW